MNPTDRCDLCRGRGWVKRPAGEESYYPAEVVTCPACRGRVAATHPDPRVHGPERCPAAPSGCDGCGGFHHWVDAGFDPGDPDADAPTEQAVAAWDRAHGTEHAPAYFACKHCPTWAECEYVWEVESGEYDFGDEDLDAGAGKGGVR